ALSIAYSFGGRSWRDALCDAGFDVWGLDFYGFGGSDRYPEMDEAPELAPPLCGAADAAEQLLAAIRFILAHQQLTSLSIISHSWGSMPSGIVAASHPTLIDRIVFFAPITKRGPRRYERPPAFPSWRLVSVEDQWNRFVEDVPEQEPAVLSRLEFDGWAEAYLDTDPDSRSRMPPAVKTPAGPLAEIIAAWHGSLPWDPAAVQVPAAIVRGEWDGLIMDEDAAWLFNALSRSPNRRDVKISRSTHLMHLEMMRQALWRESIAFLLGEDVAPVPQH
ncbi:MAG: alpha/beta fold hydrolase, partial [Bradyrhizobium sp.]|nr:alpha/beta fold hydrolase [Bradyrhizobium sp.]